VGPSALQSIFDHWSNNSPEEYAPNYVSSTNSYILQQHYAQLTTTYALFYDQFNNHEAIDKWLVEWGTKYENTKTKNSVNNCPYQDLLNFLKLQRNMWEYTHKDRSFRFLFL
jgi:hypothetical protein